VRVKRRTPAEAEAQLRGYAQAALAIGEAVEDEGVEAEEEILQSLDKPARRGASVFRSIRLARSLMRAPRSRAVL
jgi:hypothetical protein